MDNPTICLFVLWTLVVLLILTGSPRVGWPKMSPALAQAQPGQDSTQLLALANGFNALLEAAKQLTRQEQFLRSRLQSAHDEVCGDSFRILSFAWPVCALIFMMRKTRILALDLELLLQR